MNVGFSGSLRIFRAGSADDCLWWTISWGYYAGAYNAAANPTSSSAEPTAKSAVITRGTESLRTLRWRRQSRANPSLNLGFPEGGDFEGFIGRYGNVWPLFWLISAGFLF